MAPTPHHTLDPRAPHVPVPKEQKVNYPLDDRFAMEHKVNINPMSGGKLPFMPASSEQVQNPVNGVVKGCDDVAFRSFPAFHGAGSWRAQIHLARSQPAIGRPLVH
jgi:hypothetical protein